MAVETYTTYDDVRAILGVSDEDLEDVTLGLSVYSSNLDLELLAVDDTLPATFVSTSATAVSARTATQRKFLTLTSLFAAYTVASQVGTSLALFAPQSTSDSKTTVTRFSGDSFQKVLDKVDAQKERLSVELSAAFADVSGGAAATTPIPTLLYGVAPAIDRVTNA